MFASSKIEDGIDLGRDPLFSCVEQAESTVREITITIFFNILLSLLVITPASFIYSIEFPFFYREV